MRRYAAPNDLTPQELDGLSHRERQVTIAQLDGLTTDAIAELIGISRKSVSVFASLARTRVWRMRQGGPVAPARQPRPPADGKPERGARAFTVSGKMTKVEAAALVEYPDGVERPRTRGDCIDGPRPCPWASCSHHLYLDVNSATGALKLNFPDLEVDEMRETCVLDVADRGPVTLDVVATAMNLTRQGANLIEINGLARARKCQEP